MPVCVVRGNAKQSALVAVPTSREAEQQLCKMPRGDPWIESKKEGWKTRNKLKKHQCGTGAAEIQEKERGSFYAGGSKKLIYHLHCNTNGLWGDKFNRLSLYNL